MGLENGMETRSHVMGCSTGLGAHQSGLEMGRAGWAVREGKNGAAGVREREESENHKRRITRWALRACWGWTGWTICMMTGTETRATSRGRPLGRRPRTG